MRKERADGSGLLVLVDPFTFKPADRAAFENVMEALKHRCGDPAAVAVFNPGTHNRGGWDDWKGVDNLIESSAPDGWYRDRFLLRRRHTGATGKAGPGGRVQHYGLHLLSSQAAVVARVREKWNARCRDADFARWAQVHK